MNVEEADRAHKDGIERWKGHKITGIILSVTGLSWLARKAGWMGHDSVWVMHHETGGILLPVLLIALGLMLIAGVLGNRKKHSSP